MAISNNIARSGLLVKKFTPEILVAIGTISVVSGVILSAKAGTKADGIFKERDEQLKKIEEVKSYSPKAIYTENDYKKDKLIVKTKTGMALAKNYLPGATLAGGGIICFLVAANILKQRNLAIVGAYKLLEKSFTGYRERIMKSFGKDIESMVYKGYEFESKDVLVSDKKGNVKLEKDMDLKKTGTNHTSFLFDEFNSSAWERTPNYNKSLILCQQSHANDRLKAHGHVFLNEVLDMLRMPHTSEGQLLGWIYDEKHPDTFIDFGLYDGSKEKERFLNGTEPNVWLDFNVTGVIYDLI